MPRLGCGSARQFGWHTKCDGTSSARRPSRVTNMGQDKYWYVCAQNTADVRRRREHGTVSAKHEEADLGLACESLDY